MKQILKPLLKYYLKFWTKLALIIHRPKVIVIAGSINKYFTKMEIKKVIEEKGIEARVSPKNFNTEIGLPLSILNLKSGYNNYKNWLPAILNAPKSVFQKTFPSYLVVELGTSDPGDMKYLLSLVKPNIAIITDITQRYIEGFSDLNELAKEYETLVKSVPKEGLTIINSDNPRVNLAAKSAKSPVTTFGINNKSDWQAVQIAKNNDSQEFVIKNKDAENKIKIKNFGTHHVYAKLAAEIVRYNLAIN